MLVWAPPMIWTVPVNCTLLLTFMAADPVIVTLAVGLRGTQVAAQLALPTDLRESGGSPLENVVTTEPVLMALAQSSTTVNCIAAGKPAGTLKLLPSIVKTGSNFDGVQAAAVAFAFAAAAAGVTTRSTSMG